MPAKHSRRTAPHPLAATAEQRRLASDKSGREPWRKWGPYLADRQWGTVREDYSAGGDAWDCSKVK